MVATTDDINITEEDMLEFAESIALPRRKPGELTSQILANTAGISKRWASDRLNRLERDGLVHSKWIYENQRKVKAFVPIKGSWKDLLV
jgi:hypothetical protein